MLNLQGTITIALDQTIINQRFLNGSNAPEIYVARCVGWRWGTKPKVFVCERELHVRDFLSYPGLSYHVLIASCWGSCLTPAYNYAPYEPSISIVA